MSLPEFVTTDVHLASFLRSRGAWLTVNERVRPKLYRFGFVADRDLHNLLRAYWSGAYAAVVPSVLLATPVKLKSAAIGRGVRRSALSTASGTSQRSAPDAGMPSSSGPVPPLHG